MPEAITQPTDTITINPLILAILDAPLPSLIRSDLRREPRKTIAAEIRKLFRAMGLKGISVTAPNYSMASSVDVTTPKNDPEPIVKDDEYGGYSLHPVYRDARNEVLRKVGEIILTAFPDLDDRSDYMTDYYDSKLSIH